MAEACGRTIRVVKLEPHAGKADEPGAGLYRLKPRAGWSYGNDHPGEKLFEITNVHRDPAHRTEIAVAQKPRGGKVVPGESRVVLGDAAGQGLAHWRHDNRRRAWCGHNVRARTAGYESNKCEEEQPNDESHDHRVSPFLRHLDGE